MTDYKCCFNVTEMSAPVLSIKKLGYSRNEIEERIISKSAE